MRKPFTIYSIDREEPVLGFVHLTYKGYVISLATGWEYPELMVWPEDGRPSDSVFGPIDASAEAVCMAIGVIEGILNNKGLT